MMPSVNRWSSWSRRRRRALDGPSQRGLGRLRHTGGSRTGGNDQRLGVLGLAARESPRRGLSGGSEHDARDGQRLHRARTPQSRRPISAASSRPAERLPWSIFQRAAVRRVSRDKTGQSWSRRRERSPPEQRMTSPGAIRRPARQSPGRFRSSGSATSRLAHDGPAQARRNSWRRCWCERSAHGRRRQLREHFRSTTSSSTIQPAGYPPPNRRPPQTLEPPDPLRAPTLREGHTAALVARSAAPADGRGSPLPRARPAARVTPMCATRPTTQPGKIECGRARAGDHQSERGRPGQKSADLSSEPPAGPLG